MPCALANNFGHWETIAGHDPDVPFQKVTILRSSCARNRHRDATGVMQSVQTNGFISSPLIGRDLEARDGRLAAMRRVAYQNADLME